LIHNYFDPNKIIFKSIFHQNRSFHTSIFLRFLGETGERNFQSFLEESTTRR